MENDSTHKFSELLDDRSDHRLRIRFSDGEIYVLTNLSAVAFDIYHVGGKWSGTIVEAFGLSPERLRLYTLGSCIDIEERDVLEIGDVTTQEQLFLREKQPQQFCPGGHAAHWV